MSIYDDYDFRQARFRSIDQDDNIPSGWVRLLVPYRRRSLVPLPMRVGVADVLGACGAAESRWEIARKMLEDCLT